MAEKKEKPSKSFRLSAAQVEIIEALAANGILGTNRSDVVRALLERAIQELVKSDYVRMHQETLERLKKKSSA